MLDLLDVVALGVWLDAPRRRLAALLAAADCPSLESILGRLRPLADPVAGARSLRLAAEQALAAAARSGLTAVPWGDTRYPALLAAIPDPPPVLWAAGDVASLSRAAVAIVGSRAASPYGLEVARQLAADLASARVVVVSGLARGTDAAAHRGAVEAGGTSVAVLGSGADVIYPPEHAPLASGIASGGGAVVSELPPGTPPRPFHFPARNRIISGLSLAVVVVEAAARSGSLITARFALDQGRDVLAVPGEALSGRFRGCHALIRDGAALVESAEDVLAEIAAGSLMQFVAPRPRPETDTDPLLAALAGSPGCTLDELADRTGWPPQRLLPRLLALELQGTLARAPGGRFVRRTNVLS